MSIKKLIILPLAAFMLLSLFAAPTFAGRKRSKILKIATLAPEGSTWWQILKDADKRIRELTNGSVKIRLYAGGVAGDEPDVVRKMRVGQLHGGALTSVGLAEIQPELMVLQAPGVIQSWDELDAARTAMGEKLKALLREKGYEVLVWGDVGFTRIFSNAKIENPVDIQSTKPWCWTQDGLTRELFKSLKVNPVMLSIAEVLPGLQTGLLNSYAVAPLVSLSLQWFTRSKYMYDLPINVTIGAVVLSKKKFDTLTEEEKAAIQQAGREITPKMERLVRGDNQKAIEAIKKAGVTIVTPTPDQMQAWRKVALASAKASAGHVYSADLLEQLQAAVDAYRKNGK